MFKKGQSGNPNGRPKGSPNKISRIKLKEAIEKQISYDELVVDLIAEHKNGNLKASQMLIEHAVGKPVTEIEQTSNTTINAIELDKVFKWKDVDKQ